MNLSDTINLLVDNIKSFIFNLNIWIKVLLVASMIVIGFLVYRNRTASTPDVQTQTGQVEKGNLVVTITATGTVSNTNITQIKTGVSGVVKKLYIKDGETVKAGQKIADLELDDSGRQKYYQALSSYQSAKNSLDSANATLYSLNSSMYAANVKLIDDAVARDLATDDPTYVQQNSDWLAAEAKYKIQQESIKQSKLSVSNSYLALAESSPTITAPISGVITGMEYQEGSVISNSNENTIFASVITAAKPTIKVLLTESDIGKINNGNSVTVAFDALSEVASTGKVVSIDKAGVTSSGVTNYPVYIQLDVANDKILANMAASANIITDLITDTLLVPSSAVKTANGVSTVTLQTNGVTKTVEVSIGKSNDTQTEIKSGLNEGDTIIISTTTRLPTSTSNQTTSPFGRQSGAGSATFVRRQ